MSESMRGEFEAWRVDNFCGGIERLKKCSNAPEVYYYTAEQDAWRAWKASRAALCVELPPSVDMPDEDDCDGYEEYEAMEAITCTANGMRHACRNAIHAAGVKTNER